MLSRRGTLTAETCIYPPSPKTPYSEMHAPIAGSSVDALSIHGMMPGSIGNSMFSYILDYHVGRPGL